MKISEIVDALERFAPLPLQADYDNSGLQVGLTDVEATGALLCLDVTEEVISEAVQLGYNLVISHHPLLFRGLKQISDVTQVQRCVLKAIQHGITVYAAHTNMDSAPQGVNYLMAQKLGLLPIGFLTPTQVNGIQGGDGMLASFEQPMSEDDFLQLLATTFGASHLRYSAKRGKCIQTVALCGGSGSFLIPQAVGKADAFVTGEIGYHNFFEHTDKLMLVELGHYESEQYTVEIFKSIIRELDSNLPVAITSVLTNPINYL